MANKLTSLTKTLITTAPVTAGRNGANPTILKALRAIKAYTGSPHQDSKKLESRSQPLATPYIAQMTSGALAVAAIGSTLAGVPALSLSLAGVVYALDLLRKMPK